MKSYTAPQAININLNGLASSRQGAQSSQQVSAHSDLIDNRSSGHDRIHLWLKIKLGANPSGDTRVFIHRIDGDGSTPILASDGLGADAGFAELKNSRRLCDLMAGQTPQSGDELVGHCVIDNPGPWWGVAIFQNTEVPLATSGHVVRWVGETNA